MKDSTRIRIFEFLVVPAQLWMGACAWLVGGVVVWRPGDFEDDGSGDWGED